MPTAAAADPGGLTGTVLDAMEAFGAVGVGLAVLAETVVPPILSEVVLSVAGYLTQTGRMSLAAVFLAAVPDVGLVLAAAAVVVLGVGRRWRRRSRRLEG